MEPSALTAVSRLMVVMVINVPDPGRFFLNTAAALPRSRSALVTAVSRPPWHPGSSGVFDAATRCWTALSVILTKPMQPVLKPSRNHQSRRESGGIFPEGKVAVSEELNG